MSKMLSNKNTTIYIIPHEGTSRVRVDGDYPIQDLIGWDKSKPRAVNVSLVEHSGIHSKDVVVGPDGRKGYLIKIKLHGHDLTGLDDMLSKKCIVCVPYNNVDTIVYGLDQGLSWEEDKQKFWSDNEEKPIKMKTEDARKWDQTGLSAYDDFEKFIHNCYGSNDFVFQAGQSEREAADAAKLSIETEGLSEAQVRERLENWLLHENSKAPSSLVQSMIEDALDFFFPNAANVEDSLIDEN